mgnify:CR=1 FL=1
MGFDYYSSYFVLVLPAVLFAMWAQMNVSITFKKYSSVQTSSHISAADAARMVLEKNGVSGVAIEHINGNLTDCYDPRTNKIYLSDSVYSSSSAAAIGVACHEAGHAVQFAKGYTPVKIRTAIIPLCSVSSNIAMPLVILGIILDAFNLALIGVAAFAVATLFQLVTLPVEFNASARAMEAIKGCSYMNGDDISAARKTLRAAALTYVAALFVSLANLLRLIILVSGSGNRKR